MRRLLAVMSLALIFSLLIAIPAQASESGQGLRIDLGEVELTQVLDGESPGRATREPAIPVTNVVPTSLQIMSNGNVQLTMHVFGQGNFTRHVSTLGASRLIRTEFGSGWAPVLDFYHIFDIGPARLGAHSWEYTLICVRTGTVWSARIPFTIS